MQIPKTIILGFKEGVEKPDVLAVGADGIRAFAAYKHSGELPKGYKIAANVDRDRGLQAIAIPVSKPKNETKGSK